ncbi:DNA polymerase III subunit delta' [Lederbergia citrea]|uniref:DNA polymerase III subunit delta' n=1 Tax=Lederbergia citrea TaxID=2833581 RepID=A0A942Z707_9BACI|nr:DNA polymerase III subunit delta' [Lederbergia citrea]MBS4179756.1 DNA polymerase III subunit delta' [Lederbergia citrea]MBS4206395.1 DNA polymerase III subunit delta' [Lederbergia citrea]MBS4225015.1 DNA polymerase III subunit delta' [Lederbergia citrea]
MSMTWQDLEQEQPFAAKMLKNSIEKKRVAHAYLFEGDHGTGKRAASMLMAETLFCEKLINNYIPCGSCINCKRIKTGNHPDVHVVQPDGLSIKIEQIRSLRTEFSKSGVESNKKLYIIIDAEKMTISAANSLLKFLEEPNSETMAFLVTDQSQRILPTILSRCQSIAFKSLPPELFIKKLQDNGVNHVKAPLIAAITNNLQEGLELDSDDWFAQARKIVLKLYEVLKQNPLYAMTSLQDEWTSHFKEKAQLDMGLNLLLLIYKDVLYVQLGKEGQLVYPDQLDRFKGDALQSSSRRLSEQMTAILEAKRKLNANINPQLLMEQLVLNLQGGPSFV